MSSKDHPHRMWILVALTLLTPSIALATPVSFSFTGETGAGPVTGTFTYETDQSPAALDVRGLLGNATYVLSSWNFIASSNVEGLPTTTFSHTIPGNTAEFCQGKCIFASPPAFTNLRLVSNNVLLQLTFNLADATPLASPPEAREWGAFNVQGSQFRINNGVPLALAIRGNLSPSSVPESGSWLSLLVGLAGVVTYLRWR